MTEPETITVEVGVPFTVEIPSTPTTGYRWQVGDLPAEVDLVESSFRADRGGQPGDGGTAVFVLIAHAAGQHRIEVRLQRPWEAAPVQTHTVTAHVH